MRYPLSLHDALPISGGGGVLPAASRPASAAGRHGGALRSSGHSRRGPGAVQRAGRSAGADVEACTGGGPMVTRVERRTIAVDGEGMAGAMLSPRARIPGVLFVHGGGGGQRRDLSRARGIAGGGGMWLTFAPRGRRDPREA